MSSSILDSTANFESRSKEIGLLAAELENVKAKGWNKFGTFAFACGHTPGAIDETPLRQLAAVVCGTAPEGPPEDRMPVIRRLYFESYTLASADLKARVERRDDDTPKKLPLPERAARYDDQVARLSGIELVGDHECSYALIDLVGQQAEDNGLRYVRWEQCTTRDQEVQGVKVDPVWKPDASGVVREVKMPDHVTADLAGDLRLRSALTRRALAYDQWRIVDFNLMERWHKRMINSYLKEPVRGYRRVTLEQLSSADQELWRMVMRETRRGIRPLPSGALPAEEALKKVFQAKVLRSY